MSVLAIYITGLLLSALIWIWLTKEYATVNRKERVVIVVLTAVTWPLWILFAALCVAGIGLAELHDALTQDDFK